MYEWDEAKRQKTLDKHGLDFRRVLAVFDGPFLEVAANSEIEPRRIAVGPIGEMLVAVVFTLRGNRIRLITARRARDNEIRAYRARYS